MIKYLLFILGSMVVENAAFLTSMAPELTAKNNPVLMRLLQTVDAATTDEHLLDVSLQLLKSVCLCMRETLKAKQLESLSFSGDTNSLQAEDDTRDSSKKVLDLYQNIYNKTCFDLKNEVATKVNKSARISTDEENDFMLRSDCGKIPIHTSTYGHETPNQVTRTNKNDATLKDILYQTFIKTRNYHRFRARKYSLYRATEKQTRVPAKHNIIVILTFYPSDDKSSSITNCTKLTDQLNNTLLTNSPIDIDIIDARFGQKENVSDESLIAKEATDCTLKSIYIFLLQSERNNNTKVFKLMRRSNTIKVYIDVNSGPNHSDYTKTCCNNRTDVPLCKMEFSNESFDSKEITTYPSTVEKPNNFKDTISKIKSLVKLYDKKLMKKKLKRLSTQPSVKRNIVKNNNKSEDNNEVVTFTKKIETEKMKITKSPLKIISPSTFLMSDASSKELWMNNIADDESNHQKYQFYNTDTPETTSQNTMDPIKNLTEKVDHIEKGETTAINLFTNLVILSNEADAKRRISTESLIIQENLKGNEEQPLPEPAGHSLHIPGVSNSIHNKNGPTEKGYKTTATSIIRQEQTNDSRYLKPHQHISGNVKDNPSNGNKGIITTINFPVENTLEIVVTANDKQKKLTIDELFAESHLNDVNKKSIVTGKEPTYNEDSILKTSRNPYSKETLFSICISLSKSTRHTDEFTLNKATNNIKLNTEHTTLLADVRKYTYPDITWDINNMTKQQITSNISNTGTQGDETKEMSTPPSQPWYSNKTLSNKEMEISNSINDSSKSLMGILNAKYETTTQKPYEVTSHSIYDALDGYQYTNHSAGIGKSNATSEELKEIVMSTKLVNNYSYSTETVVVKDSMHEGNTAYIDTIGKATTINSNQPDTGHNLTTINESTEILPYRLVETSGSVNYENTKVGTGAPVPENITYHLIDIPTVPNIMLGQQQETIPSDKKNEKKYSEALYSPRTKFFSGSDVTEPTYFVIGLDDDKYRQTGKTESITLQSSHDENQTDLMQYNISLNQSKITKDMEVILENLGIKNNSKGLFETESYTAMPFTIFNKTKLLDTWEIEERPKLYESNPNTINITNNDVAGTAEPNTDHHINYKYTDAKDISNTDKYSESGFEPENKNPTNISILDTKATGVSTISTYINKNNVEDSNATTTHNTLPESGYPKLSETRGYVKFPEGLFEKNSMTDKDLEDKNKTFKINDGKKTQEISMDKIKKKNINDNNPNISSLIHPTLMKSIARSQEKQSKQILQYSTAYLLDNIEDKTDKTTVTSTSSLEILKLFNTTRELVIVTSNDVNSTVSGIERDYENEIIDGTIKSAIDVFDASSSNRDKSKGFLNNTKPYAQNQNENISAQQILENDTLSNPTGYSDVETITKVSQIISDLKTNSLIDSLNDAFVVNSQVTDLFTTDQYKNSQRTDQKVLSNDDDFTILKTNKYGTLMKVAHTVTDSENIVQKGNELFDINSSYASKSDPYGEHENKSNIINATLTPDKSIKNSKIPVIAELALGTLNLSDIFDTKSNIRNVSREISNSTIPYLLNQNESTAAVLKYNIFTSNEDGITTSTSSYDNQTDSFKYTLADAIDLKSQVTHQYSSSKSENVVTSTETHLNILKSDMVEIPLILNPNVNYSKGEALYNLELESTPDANKSTSVDFFKTTLNNLNITKEILNSTEPYWYNENEETSAGVLNDHINFTDKGKQIMTSVVKGNLDPQVDAFKYPITDTVDIGSQVNEISSNIPQTTNQDSNRQGADNTATAIEKYFTIFKTDNNNTPMVVTSTVNDFKTESLSYYDMFHINAPYITKPYSHSSGENKTKSIDALLTSDKINENTRNENKINELLESTLDTTNPAFVDVLNTNSYNTDVSREIPGNTKYQLDNQRDIVSLTEPSDSNYISIKNTTPITSAQSSKDTHAYNHDVTKEIPDTTKHYLHYRSESKSIAVPRDNNYTRFKNTTPISSVKSSKDPQAEVLKESHIDATEIKSYVKDIFNNISNTTTNKYPKSQSGNNTIKAENDYNIFKTNGDLSPIFGVSIVDDFKTKTDMSSSYTTKSYASSKHVNQTGDINITNTNQNKLDVFKEVSDNTIEYTTALSDNSLITNKDRTPINSVADNTPTTQVNALKYLLTDSIDINSKVYDSISSDNISHTTNRNPSSQIGDNIVPYTETYFDNAKTSKEEIPMVVAPTVEDSKIEALNYLGIFHLNSSYATNLDLHGLGENKTEDINVLLASNIINEDIRKENKLNVSLESTTTTNFAFVDVLNTSTHNSGISKEIPGSTKHYMDNQTESIRKAVLGDNNFTSFGNTIPFTSGQSNDFLAEIVKESHIEGTGIKSNVNEIRDDISYTTMKYIKSQSRNDAGIDFHILKTNAGENSIFVSPTVDDFNTEAQFFFDIFDMNSSYTTEPYPSSEHVNKTEDFILLAGDKIHLAPNSTLDTFNSAFIGAVNTNYITLNVSKDIPGDTTKYRATLKNNTFTSNKDRTPINIVGHSTSAPLVNSLKYLLTDATDKKPQVYEISEIISHTVDQDVSSQSEDKIVSHTETYFDNQKSSKDRIPMAVAPTDDSKTETLNYFDIFLINAPCTTKPYSYILSENKTENISVLQTSDKSNEDTGNENKTTETPKSTLEVFTTNYYNHEVSTLRPESTKYYMHSQSEHISIAVPRNNNFSSIHNTSPINSVQSSNLQSEIHKHSQMDATELKSIVNEIFDEISNTTNKYPKNLIGNITVKRQEINFPILKTNENVIPLLVGPTVEDFKTEAQNSFNIFDMSSSHTTMSYPSSEKTGDINIQLTSDRIVFSTKSTPDTNNSTFIGITNTNYNDVSREILDDAIKYTTALKSFPSNKDRTPINIVTNSRPAPQVTTVKYLLTDAIDINSQVYENSEHISHRTNQKPISPSGNKIIPYTITSFNNLDTIKDETPKIVTSTVDDFKTKALNYFDTDDLNSTYMTKPDKKTLRENMSDSINILFKRDKNNKDPIIKNKTSVPLEITQDTGLVIRSKVTIHYKKPLHENTTKPLRQLKSNITPCNSWEPIDLYTNNNNSIAKVGKLPRLEQRRPSLHNAYNNNSYLDYVFENISYTTKPYFKTENMAASKMIDYSKVPELISVNKESSSTAETYSDLPISGITNKINNAMESEIKLNVSLIKTRVPLKFTFTDVIQSHNISQSTKMFKHIKTETIPENKTQTTTVIYNDGYVNSLKTETKPATVAYVINDSKLNAYKTDLPEVLDVQSKLHDLTNQISYTTEPFAHSQSHSKTDETYILFKSDNLQSQEFNNIKNEIPNIVPPFNDLLPPSMLSKIKKIFRSEHENVASSEKTYASTPFSTFKMDFNVNLPKGMLSTQIPLHDQNKNTTTVSFKNNEEGSIETDTERTQEMNVAQTVKIFRSENENVPLPEKTSESTPFSTYEMDFNTNYKLPRGMLSTQIPLHDQNENTTTVSFGNNEEESLERNTNLTQEMNVAQTVKIFRSEHENVASSEKTSESTPFSTFEMDFNANYKLPKGMLSTQIPLHDQNENTTSVSFGNYEKGRIETNTHLTPEMNVAQTVSNYVIEDHTNVFDINASYTTKPYVRSQSANKTNDNLFTVGCKNAIMTGNNSIVQSNTRSKISNLLKTTPVHRPMQDIVEPSLVDINFDVKILSTNVTDTSTHYLRDQNEGTAVTEPTYYSSNAPKTNSDLNYMTNVPEPVDLPILDAHNYSRIENFDENLIGKAKVPVINYDFNIPVANSNSSGISYRSSTLQAALYNITLLNNIGFTSTVMDEIHVTTDKISTESLNLISLIHSSLPPSNNLVLSSMIKQYSNLPATYTDKPKVFLAEGLTEINTYDINKNRINVKEVQAAHDIKTFPGYNYSETNQNNDPVISGILNIAKESISHDTGADYVSTVPYKYRSILTDNDTQPYSEKSNTHNTGKRHYIYNIDQYSLRKPMTTSVPVIRNIIDDIEINPSTTLNYITPQPLFMENLFDITSDDTILYSSDIVKHYTNDMEVEDKITRSPSIVASFPPTYDDLIVSNTVYNTIDMIKNDDVLNKLKTIPKNILTNDFSKYMPSGTTLNAPDQDKSLALLKTEAPQEDLNKNDFKTDTSDITNNYEESTEYVIHDIQPAKIPFTTINSIQETRIPSNNNALNITDDNNSKIGDWNEQNITTLSIPNIHLISNFLGKKVRIKSNGFGDKQEKIEDTKKSATSPSELIPTHTQDNTVKSQLVTAGFTQKSNSLVMSNINGEGKKTMQDALTLNTMTESTRDSEKPLVHGVSFDQNALGTAHYYYVEKENSINDKEIQVNDNVTKHKDDILRMPPTNVVKAATKMLTKVLDENGIEINTLPTKNNKKNKYLVTRYISFNVSRSTMPNPPEDNSDNLKEELITTSRAFASSEFIDQVTRFTLPYPLTTPGNISRDRRTKDVIGKPAFTTKALDQNQKKLFSSLNNILETKNFRNTEETEQLYPINLKVDTSYRPGFTGPDNNTMFSNSLTKMYTDNAKHFKASNTTSKKTYVVMVNSKEINNVNKHDEHYRISNVPFNQNPFNKHFNEPGITKMNSDLGNKNKIELDGTINVKPLNITVFKSQSTTNSFIEPQKVEGFNFLKAEINTSPIEFTIHNSSTQKPRNTLPVIETMWNKTNRNLNSVTLGNKPHSVDINKIIKPFKATEENEVEKKTRDYNITGGISPSRRTTYKTNNIILPLNLESFISKEQPLWKYTESIPIIGNSSDNYTGYNAHIVAQNMTEFTKLLRFESPKIDGLKAKILTSSDMSWLPNNFTSAIGDGLTTNIEYNFDKTKLMHSRIVEDFTTSTESMSFRGLGDNNPLFKNFSYKTNLQDDTTIHNVNFATLLKTGNFLFTETNKNVILLSDATDTSPINETKESKATNDSSIHNLDNNSTTVKTNLTFNQILRNTNKIKYDADITKYYKKKEDVKNVNTIAYKTLIKEEVPKTTSIYQELHNNKSTKIPNISDHVTKYTVITSVNSELNHNSVSNTTVQDLKHLNITKVAVPFVFNKDIKNITRDLLNSEQIKANYFNNKQKSRDADDFFTKTIFIIDSTMGHSTVANPIKKVKAEVSFDTYVNKKLEVIKVETSNNIGLIPINDTDRTFITYLATHPIDIAYSRALLTSKPKKYLESLSEHSDKKTDKKPSFNPNVTTKPVIRTFKSIVYNTYKPLTEEELTLPPDVRKIVTRFSTIYTKEMNSSNQITTLKTSKARKAKQVKFDYKSKLSVLNTTKKFNKSKVFNAIIENASIDAFPNDTLKHNRKTYLHPIENLPIETQRKSLNLIKLKNRKSSIITMNTKDFLSFRRAATGRVPMLEVFKPQPMPLPRHLIKASKIHKVPRRLILRPKFNSFEDFKKYPIADPIIQKHIIMPDDKDFYKNSFQIHHKPVQSWKDKIDDVRTKAQVEPRQRSAPRKGQRQNFEPVIDVPYYMPTLMKPSLLRDRVESVRSYIYKEGNSPVNTRKHFRSPPRLDISGVAVDAPDSQEQVYYSAGASREEATEQTTPRVTRPKKTIFFLSPTVPYNRYF